MFAATARIHKQGGFGAGVTTDDFVAFVAKEIVNGGDGEKFLKAVRRGKPTQRQELRYQLLREVEKLYGDRVKRRRPTANVPDALALKIPSALTLESP